MDQMFFKISLILLCVSGLTVFSTGQESTAIAVLVDPESFCVTSISDRNISVSVPFSDKYDITVYSLNGKELLSMLDIYLTKGNNDLSIPSHKDIMSDVCFLQIKSRSERIINMFVL